MRYLLFGTAGHVDHGKTTLIKALTGIDTDRLPEEKRRGLSIDIGFAYLDFPEEDTRLEIIDIPGHERFIKNAIAGLSCVHGVLLVVDAGEGIKPQTIDHLRIAKCLGVEHYVAVLTKVDRYEAETVDKTERDLKDLLDRYRISADPVRVSAVSGEGLEALKDRLRKVIREIDPPPVHRPLRVVIDSAFPVKGYGTVIRGSCIEGRLRKGDRAILEPTGVEVRIRYIQNHGEFVGEVVAGQRVAVNVPDIKSEEVERGFWLLEKGGYIKSSRILVMLEEEITPRGIYSAYFGMREVFGRLSRIGDGVFLFSLREDIVSRRGDRFALLNSQGRLVTGGEVLHPSVRVVRRKFIKENLSLLTTNFALYLIKEFWKEGVDTEIPEKIGRVSEEDLSSEGVRVGDKYYSKDLLKRLIGSLEEILKNTREISKAEVMQKLKVGEELMDEIIKRCQIAEPRGEMIASKGKGASQIEDLISDLPEGIIDERDLKIDRELLRRAVKKRKLHRISQNLMVTDGYLRDVLKTLREIGKEFSLQEAKAKLSLTRRFLVPILEYIDYLGYTKRRGDKRYWIKDPS